MKIKKISLSKEYPELGSSKAKVIAFIHGQNKEYGLGFRRPSMVIIPGGGYGFVSEREAEPVMGRFFAEGFNCYVIIYSIYKKYPQPQLEVACAFDYINKHNDEFFNNGKIYGVGFSAGGHLLASYSAWYKELADKINVDPFSIKPTAIILSYPVITMKDNTHAGTRDVITNGDSELIKKLSIEDQVTSDYPPTFIWSTEVDSCVPIINSYLMIEALKKAGVKHDSFIYPNIDHGASIISFDTRYSYHPFSDDEKNLRTWVDRSLDFISKI